MLLLIFSRILRGERFTTNMVWKDLKVTEKAEEDNLLRISSPCSSAVEEEAEEDVVLVRVEIKEWLFTSRWKSYTTVLPRS